MLLDDDIVTQRQTESGPLAGRFGGEERVEHLFPDLRGYAAAIVPDPDLDAVAKIARRRREHRFVAGESFRLALHRRVKAVGDQVEEYPGDLLRKQLDFAGRRIEG